MTFSELPTVRETPPGPENSDYSYVFHDISLFITVRELSKKNQTAKVLLMINYNYIIIYL